MEHTSLPFLQEYLTKFELWYTKIKRFCLANRNHEWFRLLLNF